MCVPNLRGIWDCVHFVDCMVNQVARRAARLLQDACLCPRPDLCPLRKCKQAMAASGAWEMFDEENKGNIWKQRLKNRLDALLKIECLDDTGDEAVGAASDALISELRASGAARHTAVDSLLEALRLPDLPDRIQEKIAAAISLCSGAYTGPPSLYRIFSFSDSLQVKIHEIEFEDGDVGGKVWGGALLLSLFLTRDPSLTENKRVLELGSGCGLCGMLAAKLGAAEVVLTDYLPSLLVNLRQNICLSCTQEESPQSRRVSQDDFFIPRATSQSDCIVSLRFLDWLEGSTAANAAPSCPRNLILPPRLTADRDFDLIVGSDVIYDAHLIQPLVVRHTNQAARLSADRDFDFFIGRDVVYHVH